jgi:hypothetical protein
MLSIAKHWCSNASNAGHTFSARGSAVLPAAPGLGILLSRLVVEPSMAQVSLKCRQMVGNRQQQQRQQQQLCACISERVAVQGVLKQQHAHDCISLTAHS